MPQRRIRADAALRDLDEHSVGLSFCDPVSERLAGLAEIAESGGERTSRKELVAALILAAPADEAHLSSLLWTYRRATADDARLDGRASGSDLIVPQRHPGRRGTSRRSGAG